MLFTKKGKSMFRTSCVCILLIIAGSLSAEDKRSLTHFEIQQDLFSARADLSAINLQIQELRDKKKSPALAAIYSLLLPGLGEHYAESWAGTGKFFSGLEGLLWLGFATVDIYGSSLKDDARGFAVAHAGVNPAGKDDDFFVDVGNFMNTQDFNNKRLRDREAERLYDVNAGFAWQWDSDANRSLFKETRISSENVLNNRKFVVTAVIINHIASAINAARLAISYNKSINDQVGELQLKADVMGGVWNPHGVMVTLQKNF
jgi:hypothetical protein